MTYSISQSLVNVGDALVTNTTGATSLTATVTGTDSGATLLIEGSSNGSTWSTLNTITTAGSYPITFGVYPLVRARISVMGSGVFVVTLTQTLAPTGTVIYTPVSDVAVVPTNSLSAYTAGYVVGGLLHFQNVFGASFSGVLSDILIASKSVQTTTYKLYLFSQNPTHTTWTDHAAPSINASDLPYLLGVWTSGAADSGLGTETTNQTDNVNAQIHSVNQDLYGVLVCVSTPTYTSTTDLTVSLAVKQN